MSRLESQKPLAADFAEVRDRHPEIYVIVSPPRCCSTALARVFWEHPSIGFYCHEPFEIAYFRDADLDDVEGKLLEPLDLDDLCSVEADEGENLVIKEMPYQVGDHFPKLVDLATAPIVFLMRDPRLNIASRIEKKLEVGTDPTFPLAETGWELLRDQIAYCRERDIDHLIVTAEDFRDRPLELLPEVFERLGLEFSEEMISWQPCSGVDIDNLEGDHSHLYESVLASTGLEPEVEKLPPIESFPVEGGFRQHVIESLEIYDRLRALPERVGAG